MAEKVSVSGESSSDESFVAYVFESQSGLQGYQFEPRRITEGQEESSSSSMSCEESEGETAAEQQQGANRLADTATWCTCGCCSVIHLRRDKECRCCQEAASNRKFAAPSSAECTDEQLQKATKCGEDCHCVKSAFSGADVYLGGCAAGWRGTACRRATAVTGPCPDRKYGDRCQNNCNCPNRQSDACDKMAGTCTGQCSSGYTGQNCDQCIIGRYGPMCQNSCNCPNRQSAECDRTNGTCTGQCNPGYTGPDCQPAAGPCPDGKYGHRCQNNSSCPNRQSVTCDKTTGACTGQCKSGYTGQGCDQCTIGRYGSTCQITCNCPNRQPSACDQTTGACTEQCKSGYTGQGCDQCTIGRYGSTCQITCNCPNRQSSACDKITGACTGQCNTGYSGQSCDRCTTGRYGPTCQYNCNCPNRQSGACDQSTGLCTGECNSGYTGQHCNVSAAAGTTEKTTAGPLPSSAIGGIVGGVLGFVIRVVFVVVVVALRRRRRLYPVVCRRPRRQPSYPNTLTNAATKEWFPGYNKKKKFVATQGPTTFIMNDFWRMIWQLNTDAIIMLTKLKEGNKVKCDQYWPETESTIYGHINVELLATHQFEDFCVRTLTVRADGKVRTVKHFHFTQWGDHDAPEETTGVISLFSRVQEAKDEDKGPIVVHCSAGVGRTGTFIALDILLEQARAENHVDIPKCVTDIRAQRANMIQTQGQFTFLHRVLLDAWVGADSIVSTPEFAQKSASYFQPVPPSNVSRIQSEFEALGFLQTEPNPEAFSAAKTEKNRSKNRYRDHLPPDNSRTFLSTYIPGRTDYINAVYLPGYQNKFAYVSTQMPLPDTVVDFWRLVHELGSSTIIMLNTGQNEDGQYWPADDETLNLGPFEVQHQWTTSDAGNLLRQMNLIYVKGEEKKDQAVRQFCVNMWKPGSLVPASGERLINLQKTVQEWQKQNNNRPIIVHCVNGVDRTVLLCTCFSLLEKLKAEHTISVLYTVNAMRKHRPGAVPNVEQYGFCYDVVRTFIESFHTYTNFVF